MSSMNKNPDQAYWRSLEELGDTPEFRQYLDAEFPAEAETPTDALSRRRFLQIMGASVAMAGVVGCRWPEENIVPFSSRTEGVTPGQARSFATNYEISGDVRPLLVTSTDGRPTKVEGNPEHPESLGAADVYSQALVLSLYDPDRSRNVVERHKGDHRRDWSDFEAYAAEHFGPMKGDGKGLAFLVEQSSSPTLRGYQERIRQTYPAATWYEWESLSRDNVRAGAGMAFGHPVATHLDLGQAKLIVSFDDDLFQENPAALRLSREFAKGRRAEDGPMNRLYVIENNYSITGGMADHRFAVPARDVGTTLLQLVAELALNGHLDLGGDFGALKSSFQSQLAHAPAWIRTLAHDLLHHSGESVVTVGAHQPDWCHALTHLLNKALGNVDHTVRYTDVIDPGRPSHAIAMNDFAGALNNGGIESLVILGGNPAFDAPVDLGLAEAIGKLEHSVHLSLEDNETSKLCRWHLPRAHTLESWSDVTDAQGRYGVTQPLIQPLYNGRTPAELLSLFTDEIQVKPHDMVRATANGYLSGIDKTTAWKALLQDGLLNDSAAASVHPEIEGRTLIAAVRTAASSHAPELNAGNLEIAFTRDPALYDGRFANSSWLQELPDFMTKLTWDNAALFGVSTAEALDIKHGDVVALSYGGRTLEMAAYVLPGHANWSVSVSLGHGRTASGKVGTGTGFNSYELRSTAALDFADGLTVAKTGETYTLATTQDHFAIDSVGQQERENRSHILVVEGTEQEYRDHPNFAEHRYHIPPLVSLWEERKYEGYAWGMNIDLNTCTGCNSCVIACQAENNIPVVGKDEVDRGREMHWIRLDRYFQGDPDEARVAQQPVGCVHCEMAPCEQVCPVGATMHSTEGLNEMVYNRCVGTRYCANNCPYKVRRFNFFHYNSDIPEVQKMVYNPEVSIRARGVMEKCTYCTQRIEAAKITAKNEGRDVRDGEIVVACQQTCPTQAITFGDLNDKGSVVAKEAANDRSYHMLAELNLKPRTAYMARLRNPNPELAESSDGHAGH